MPSLDVPPSSCFAIVSRRPGDLGIGEDGSMAEQARPRGRESAGDLLRSLAVVLVIVLAVLALGLGRHEGSSVSRVDLAGELAGARSVASYAVLGPVGLPAGWRATSARSTGEGARL